MLWFMQSPGTPFWQALLDGDVEQVKAQLKQDPKLSEAAPPRRICRRDERLDESIKPLHFAALEGDARIAEVLIAYGADVNATGPGGDTPLHEAAASGHRTLAEHLLHRNAAVDPRDERGRTPLHRAALAGHEPTVDLLLKAGAHVESRDAEGNVPLHCLAAGGCERSVRRLLERGVEVDVCNRRKGKTPLHLVAMRSADPSACNAAMPDRHSVRAAMHKIAELLLDHGADANAVDGTGDTPLDLLHFMRGEDESDPLVKLLRKHGGQWARYRHRHAQQTSGQAMTEPARAGPTPLVPQQGIRLGRGTLTIGRSSKCEIRYRSRTLSRAHARIRYVRRGEYVIEDLGSHNGVIIDGHRIHAGHLLSPGERLTLGHYKFQFDGTHIIPLTEELSEEQLEEEEEKMNRGAASQSGG